MARDKICVEIMAATGCKYTVAMRERDRRWDARQLDAYLLAIRALPPRQETDPVRCVTCLVPIAVQLPWPAPVVRHDCPLLAKR